MPGLTIHRLTDPALLPVQLAAALRAAEAATDPLALVQVVLPAAGWRGWLARALADALGVVAGVELIDVAGFRRELPSVAPGSTLARVLAVHAALADAAAADPLLAEWLARDPDGRWRMALAQQVAQILAEDTILRPLAATADIDAPAWWRALRAALGAPAAVAALDGDRRPAALHWVAGTPPLAHDWALLSGLAAEVPVTVWLLEPAPPASAPGHPLLLQLAPATAPLPEVLAAAERPLPAAVGTPSGALAPWRSALADGRVLPLPEGALAVGAAASLEAQLRQAEAWLAARCAADPTLSPAEVLLLSPAWPEAVPWIDAVFGDAGGPGWPYRVAGRRPGSAAQRLLERLLASPDLRWSADDLLGLLREPALGLPAGGLGLLAARLAEGPVGWGLDGVTRRDWQAGNDAAHTWSTLWPALAARLDPTDPLRQRLAPLLAALTTYRESSRGLLPLSAQVAAFTTLLAAVLPDRAPAADAVWRCWQRLGHELSGVGGDPPLSQPAFAALLGPLLSLYAERDGGAPETAAPEAGLRFAPLKPGAIRPARLIVLFGLDALNFPRRPLPGPLETWRATLDALHPALAPAEPGSADRQLLLDSLWMAADATLWLYTDRDRGSTQPLPPPTPIAAAVSLLPGVTRLPPAAPRRTVRPADPGPPPRAVPPSTVALNDLCQCFREPARFQLEKVRQWKLPPPPLDDDGPLTLGPLAAWQLRSALLQRLDRGGIGALPDDPDASQAARLPPGPAGRAAWAALVAETLALWRYHQDLLLDGGQPERIEVDLAIDDPALRLGGPLTVHAGQLFERIAGQPHARHLVHAWVRALALAAMEVPQADLVLVGLTPSGPSHLVIRLPPPQSAQESLARLLGGYARAWTRPPIFTPAWGLALLEGGEREAHWHWLGSERAPGEAQQPLHRWLWPELAADAPATLAELRHWSELLLPLRLRAPWRKHWHPAADPAGTP